MKVLSFKIPKPENVLVRHQVDDVPFFYDKLHQHPEVQLTQIFKGEGNLIVGDYIGRFKPGDLILLGSDIPHVFRNDDNYYASASDKRSYSETIFFDGKIIESQLTYIDEFEGVMEFLSSLNGCYTVIDQHEFIKERIVRMPLLNGLSRLISCLEILNYIMTEPVLERLNKMGFVRNYSPREGKRMEKVVRFLMDESRRQIELSEVAAVANMNKEAFCRFFKERTRKTLTGFLNEIRISNACHLLGYKDLSVSQVANESGFANLSYFNRVFRKLKGCTPKEFRNSMSGASR
jgi:AraC-like DNA-binding protein